VSASGQVAALAAGSAQITATSEGKSSTPIAVAVTAASQIALSRTAVSFDGLAGAFPPRRWRSRMAAQEPSQASPWAQFSTRRDSRPGG
jgi:hypothetical protein